VDDKRAWERPGAFEVAEGVHRIPLELPNDGLKAVNVYAIADGDGLTLIDSGWSLERSRQQLDAGLGQIGHDLSSISRFLVTHAHIDHYTQAVVIRRLLGSQVLVGAAESASLRQVRDQRPGSMMDLDRRLLVAGADPDVVAALVKLRLKENIPGQWEDPDAWLHDGTEIRVGDRTLRVVRTPGHTTGHVVFHDAASRLLFSGDHVLPHITPSIGFEPAATRSPLSDYLSSLTIVEALGEATLLPAHGPVTDSSLRRVAELQDHHRRRLELTEAAVRSGASTGWQVAEALRWTSRGRGFEELDRFNQLLAVNETLAHLRTLAEQSRAVLAIFDGVEHFTA
jgi:glyoxylase-like metal-dependent hydrolase (beta-lactamase superfamily II)